MKLKLPKWLRREQVSLPDWARVSGKSSDRVSIVIEADTDAAMKEWLALLGIERPDQYWIEVAYQCAKLDLQSAIAGTPYDPRTSGKSAQFNFSRADQWALKKFPVGRGTGPATEGREARAHYIRIRGAMPF